MKLNKLKFKGNTEKKGIHTYRRQERLKIK